MPKGDLDAALASRFHLSVGCKIGRDPLEPLHTQLQLLAALAPDAVAMLDESIFQARTGDWLRDAASASVPPAATSFFNVHSVFGDDGNTWLHTHGLHRMGCIELDVMSVRKREVRAMVELINNVARCFLDRGVPLPEARFEAGNGITLVWLPWQTGLQRLEGAASDRDPAHAGERGILFAPAKHSPDRLESPRRYARAIESDPIFYVSPAETDRMKRLARERLPSFLALQSRFANDEKWDFTVKLGFPTGDGTSAEHLWFEVHNATKRRVDVTLLNLPYNVPSLREGQRGSFDLRLLTDWTIDSPRGHYRPETVRQLERALANDPVAPLRLLN